MNYEVKGTDRHEVSVRRDATGTLWVALGDAPEREIVARHAGGVSWTVDERAVGVALRADRAHVLLDGLPYALTVTDARRAALALGAGDQTGDVCSAMPGVVVRVLVAVGDAVREGQAVVVVEAMKMENELKSACDGVVTALPVAPGEAVEAGTLLVSIEDADAQDGGEA